MDFLCQVHTEFYTVLYSRVLSEIDLEIVCGWISFAKPKSISFTCNIVSSALICQMELRFLENHLIVSNNVDFSIGSPTANSWKTFVNMMLLGLMSRWRMSLACRYSKASTTFSFENQQNCHFLKELV